MLVWTRPRAQTAIILATVPIAIAVAVAAWVAVERQCAIHATSCPMLPPSRVAISPPRVEVQQIAVPAPVDEEPPMCSLPSEQSRRDMLERLHALQTQQRELEQQVEKLRRENTRAGNDCSPDESVWMSPYGDACDDREAFVIVQQRAVQAELGERDRFGLDSPQAVKQRREAARAKYCREHQMQL